MNQENPAHSPLRIALTRIDVIVIVVIFALLLTIATVILPTGPFSRELSPRSVCAANLKGMGTGFYAYANENSDQWPVCVPTWAIDEGKLRVTYAPGFIGSNRDVPDELLATRATGGELKTSVTRNLWSLVRLQISTQKAFICPVGEDVPNNDESPQNYWDFSKYSEVSYGYQIPFGKLGRPTSSLDPQMPVAADKGPYSGALEAGKTNPGIASLDLSSKDKAWKPWNSPNHHGEGQNVLFADGHVDWVTKPTVGLRNDHIYTRWSSPNGGITSGSNDPLPRVRGAPPTADETPMSNTDSLIYP